MCAFSEPYRKNKPSSFLHPSSVIIHDYILCTVKLNFYFYLSLAFLTELMDKL